VLARGKRGLRIKYDVDMETREITVYDFGPRGDVYRT
jgi:mRNA-degrading endonuclease RelE of RelBE toxin-antitoxin system